MWYIQVPVANMHRFPEGQSEVVSQAHYSEEVTLLESKGEWSRIATDEGYTGWVKTDSLLERDPLPHCVRLGSCFNHIYAVDDTTPHPPIITLPFNSRLEVEVTPARWLKAKLLDGTPCYVQQGDLQKEEEFFSLAKKFIGLPYTWGGKSSFGFDCSGLIQTLFRFQNLLLPRDSKDQANHPSLVTIPESEAKPGDIVFFGDPIFHVGLVVPEGVLHATVARMSTQTVLHTFKEIHETEKFAKRLYKRPQFKQL